MSNDSLLSLANDLRIACQRVSRRVRYESTSELAPHLAVVLAHLNDRPRTPGELAELERVAPPSMTKTTNCLVEKGLVARAGHPSDGRSVVLSLTDSGREVLQRIRRARDDWMVRQLEGLTKEETELLTRATALLNRVGS